MEKWRLFPAGPDDEGRRLDRVLRIAFPGLSLTSIFSSLRKGSIRVNGKKAEQDYRIVRGDVIGVSARLALLSSGGGESGAARRSMPVAPSGSSAELARLTVLETRDLLFLDKPRGMLVHGPESLETLVRAQWASEGTDSLSFTPGPLHRLDRNTSGLVTFPRTSEGGRFFSMALRERKIRKFYLALLEGELGASVRWVDILVRDTENRVTGAGLSGQENVSEGRARRADTRVTPLARSAGFTLACIEIHTGITHQIRSQAGLHGFPLSGDVKYGGKFNESGYNLHAWVLELPRPSLAGLPRIVIAPLAPAAAGRFKALFGPLDLNADIILSGI